MLMNNTGVGVLLALIAVFLSKAGVVLQKRAIAFGSGLPQFACSAPVLKAYFANRWWVAGLVSDVVSGLLQLYVATLIPVSVSKPISFLGVGLVALLAYVWLDEHLSRGQWLALAALIAAGAAYSITVTAADDAALSRDVDLSVVAGVWLGGLAIGGTMEWAIRRPSLPPMALELLLSTQISVFMSCGVAAVFGVLRAHRGFWFVFVVVQLLGWQVILAALCQQRSLKLGRLNVLQAYSNGLQLLLSVVLGRWVLNEPWPNVHLVCHFSNPVSLVMPCPISTTRQEEWIKKHSSRPDQVLMPRKFWSVHLQDPTASHTRAVALLGLLVALVAFHGASSEVPVNGDSDIGSEAAPLVVQSALEMTSNDRSESSGEQ